MTPATTRPFPEHWPPLWPALAGRRRPSLAPSGPDPLSGTIALLRARTQHDFASYKQGTLVRRVERRMSMASLGQPRGKDGAGRQRFGRYLNLLRADAGELDLLAKDLLIHVTGFFRDPTVYAALAEAVIPGLVRDQPHGQPVRIWIAGCSTGEEVYSLVILFREAITAAARDIQLQVFAFDIDAGAVATARDGLYPAPIHSQRDHPAQADRSRAGGSEAAGRGRQPRQVPLPGRGQP